jgi:hypothetical protein
MTAQPTLWVFFHTTCDTLGKYVHSSGSHTFYETYKHIAGLGDARVTVKRLRNL